MAFVRAGGGGPSDSLPSRQRAPPAHHIVAMRRRAGVPQQIGRMGIRTRAAFFAVIIIMNVQTESHQALTASTSTTTLRLPRPPAHRGRTGNRRSATYTLNHAPKPNSRVHNRAEREHPRRDRVTSHGACRRRLCARTGIDATTHSHMVQGHAARRHRTVTLSYSHADDSACTLTSPAASGCPTAAHVTLPHASGVMSLDRDN